MPDLNTGFALVVRLLNTLFQNNAARWNFQFDIGKPRRNTLFRFMNTLVQFCAEQAGSVSCRFCVLDLLLSNSFPQYSNKKKSFVKDTLPDWTFSSIKWERNRLVRYVPRLWNCSQLDKHNSKENTHLPQDKSWLAKSYNGSNSSVLAIG